MSTQVLGTRQVFDHHLKALGSGVVNDILEDYTNDSVLIIPDAVVKGRSAIRGVFENFVSDLFKPGTYEFSLDTLHVDGEVAYIIWHAKCASADIPFATDTFLVRGGKIALQTFAAKIETR